MSKEEDGSLAVARSVSSAPAEPASRWDLRHDAPKGERLRRYGIGIEVESHDGHSLWWSASKNVWLSDEQWDRTGTVSSHADCQTLAAFKRHLRKHPELQGRTVRWVNRFFGCDVVAIPAARSASEDTQQAQPATPPHGDHQ